MNANARRIKISDATIRLGAMGYTFKEKLEVLRMLGRIGVDIIELGSISETEAKSDALLYRTASAILEGCTLSVSVTADKAGIDAAWAAISGATNPRLSVALPVSTVQAEYIYHKKPEAMLPVISETVAYAKSLGAEVEFRALDSTRCELDYLVAASEAAAAAGASVVTVCDTAGESLPHEIGAIVSALRGTVAGVSIGVECSDAMGLANASALAAISAGADEVSTVFCRGGASVCDLAAAIAVKGGAMGVSLGIDTTKLSSTADRVSHLSGDRHGKSVKSVVSAYDDREIPTDADIITVGEAAAAIGYSLTEDDRARVYESLHRLGEKTGRKSITTRELDAIIAADALQVSPTYRLVSYLINSGNTITATAQITLDKNGELMTGLCAGDGPIDAAFRAIEQIIGYHYELDDFRISSVTEGKGAMGDALIRLRYEGKLYSGRGLSTDIIGAAIRAYVSALNKIVYDQNNSK
jgi:2-isopropylmalate synthase